MFLIYKGTLTPLRRCPELPMRRCLRKRLMPFAGRENPVDGRRLRHVDFEDRQHDFDACETDIRQRDIFAMAERAGFRFRLQPLLKRLQSR